MEETGKQGCFAVRLVKDNEFGVKAVLTGDHWRKENLSLAKAVAGKASREAMIKHEPPVYLIPERVVQCAVHYIDEPGIVTQMLMYAVDMSDMSADDNMKRVYNSVIQALGGTVLDISWGEPMSDEEIQEVFETFGLKVKANNDESHISNEE